jgi:hypothetical protein
MHSAIQESQHHTTSLAGKPKVHEAPGQSSSQCTPSRSQESQRSPGSRQKERQRQAEKEKMRADNLEKLRESKAWVARYGARGSDQVIEESEDEDSKTTNSGYGSEAMDLDQAESPSDNSEFWCRSSWRKEKDAKCTRGFDGESEVSSESESESDDMLAHGSCRIPQTQRESSSGSSSSSSDSEAGNQIRRS